MRRFRRDYTHSLQGPSGRACELSGRVGFDTLPDQLVNREMKRGFSFNILVIGLFAGAEFNLS